MSGGLSSEIHESWDMLGDIPGFDNKTGKDRGLGVSNTDNRRLIAS